MKSQGERLAYAIRVAGYRTKAEFAEVAGVEAVTLRQQINRDSVPSEATALYARKLRHLGVTTDWLLFGSGPGPGEPRGVPADIAPDDGQRPTLPIRHYVGAGDIVNLIDDDPDLGHTAAPPGFERGSAVIVRGESMRPLYQEGDLLFFRTREEPPRKHLPNRAVIVQVTDGPLYLKKLLPGTRKGFYHLMSVNPITAPLLDQHVESIARIGWVKPVDE